MAVRTIIAGAFGPEIVPFAEFAKASKRLVVLETGVGLITSASGLTESLVELRTKLAVEGHELKDCELVFVGTVGAVSSDIPLLSLIGVEGVRLVDVSVLSQKAYWPEIISVEETAHETLTKKIRRHVNSEILSGKVFCSGAVTFDSDLMEYLKIAVPAYQYESLELFSVAQVCQRFGIPWAAFCAVTNIVGPGGHKQWKESHQAAAQKTFDTLLPWLKSSF